MRYLRTTVQMLIFAAAGLTSGPCGQGWLIAALSSRSGERDTILGEWLHDLEGLPGLGDER